MNKKNAAIKKGRLIVILLWVVVFSPFVLILSLLLLAGAGAFGRLPSFVELENPKSNLATEIYSDTGEVIGTFYIENRSYMQYEELFPVDSLNKVMLGGKEVPPVVAALIATEDERFTQHGGVDIPSLFRVGIKTIAMRNQSQGGGSTITQQLAKNLFPRDTVRNRSKVGRTTKLVVTKLKEWITAVKLEYNYTKEEIATMYLNTVAYGSNAYGIKSAAQTFFNKMPEELKIEEAALLVGVVNAPTRYSPVSNPESALTRRNLVISRLATAGAISREVADSLSANPIDLDYSPVSNNYGQATYFREMLRLTMNAERPKRSQFYNDWDYEQAIKQYDENPIYGWCKKNTKADGTPYNIYRDGLKIYTTINADMQRYAEEMVQKQMESVIQPMMDQQYKWTGKLFNDASKSAVESIMNNAIKYSDRYYQMNRAGFSQEEILRSFDKECKMKVFTYKGERDTIMTPRDSILHHKRIMRAGFVAMDPRNGNVKAYVGGTNFKYFKYDMAKQGKRQIGSTIKPFIYTFAIDQLGLTPCTQVPNLPVTIETATGAAWSPKEAGNVEYDGVMHPLAWGLAMSRNNYSASIMKQAKQPTAVANFIHNLGIKSYIDPVPALCLGTSESNVFELVGAYSTFVNQGVYTDPIFVTRIEDRQGNVISTFIPQSQDAISETTAYTMLGMLQGVAKGGTASRLNWAYNMADVEVGGKTGTSQKNRDAWFMCVTPRLVAGAWVGGEDQYVHLLSRGEGSVMALPIVGSFFEKVYKNPNLDISRTDRFIRPLSAVTYNCNDEKYTTQLEREEDSIDNEFFE
ncbi:MAG: transglycosylase domain-containing protein [Rikenellaceae bacterium]